MNDTKRIFTLTLIEDGDDITVQADYTGQDSAVFELGLELLSDLVAIERAGEGIHVSPLVRSGTLH